MLPPRLCSMWSHQFQSDPVPSSGANHVWEVGTQIRLELYQSKQGRLFQLHCWPSYSSTVQFSSKKQSCHSTYSFLVPCHDKTGNLSRTNLAVERSAPFWSGGENTKLKLAKKSSTIEMPASFSLFRQLWALVIAVSFWLVKSLLFSHEPHTLAAQSNQYAY